MGSTYLLVAVLLAAQSTLVFSQAGNQCEAINMGTLSATCNTVVYDFSTLYNNDAGTPFDATNGNYDYAFDITSDFPAGFKGCTAPIPTGICSLQIDNQNPGNCFNIGEKQSGQAFLDPTVTPQTLTLKFTHNDGADRITLAIITCAAGQQTPIYTASGEDPTLTYTVAFQHCSACAAGCGAPPPGPPSPGPSPSPGPTTAPPSPSPTPKPKGGGGGGGKEIGWILVGVFLGTLFIYFAAGTAFLHFRQGATGREMIPQVDFWTSLPGLVKDGFLFTIAKARRQEYQPL